MRTLVAGVAMIMLSSAVPASGQIFHGGLKLNRQSQIIPLGCEFTCTVVDDELICTRTYPDAAPCPW